MRATSDSFPSTSPATLINISCRTRISFALSVGAFCASCWGRRFPSLLSRSLRILYPNRTHSFAAGAFIRCFLRLPCFFSGGLIPTYMVITGLGLYNKIWALVLPTAMNAWNMVLLINFFRQVPPQMEEAAMLEGAGNLRILVSIYLPVSLPALATVILFTAVQHWNNWFDGAIYMNSAKMPLQSYIYNMINEINILTSQGNLSAEDQARLDALPGKTLRSAQIFIAMLPIMLVYPFAQKFFVKGLVVGSVKE